MMSQAEMRKHPGSPRSIASYLNQKTLTLDDRELIAEVTRPKDWSAKFLDLENLTEDELNIRSVVLSRIQKYPAIKVLLFVRFILCDHKSFQAFQFYSTKNNAGVFKWCSLRFEDRERSQIRRNTRLALSGVSSDS